MRTLPKPCVGALSPSGKYTDNPVPRARMKYRKSLVSTGSAKA